MYQALLVLTVATHLCFVAFVMFGGFLALRWPRLIYVHVPIVIYGIAIEIVDWPCPLTTLEIWTRDKLGWSQIPKGGFIDHYVSGPILGDHSVWIEIVALLVCVLTSWVLVAVFAARRRSVRRRAAAPAPPIAA